MLLSMLVLSSTPVRAEAPPLPRWTQIGGIDALVVEKHDTPLVSLTVSFPVGAYLDPSDRIGLANFMGEMLLRGTAKKTRDQLENELDALGASVTCDTGYHSLQLRAQVLRSNLDRLTSLLAEILTEPAFPDAEIEKLREEITANIHLRLENDQSLAQSHFNRQIYEGHPYAQEVIGTIASLKTIKRSDVEAFYRKQIGRSGALFGAAGDIDLPTVQKMIPALLGPLKPGQGRTAPVPFQRTLSGRDVHLIDKPERTQTQFLIGLPGVNATDDDYFALRVFQTAFGGHMFQAQYMREIRVKNGWAYGAYADLDSRRDGGVFSLFTYPKVKDTLPALKRSLELLKNAASGKGLTDKQIDFAKTYLIRSFPFIVDTPEKVLSQMMVDRILGRPDDYLATYRSKIEAITPKRAREAAKKYIDTNNLEIVILCTAKDFESKIGKALSTKSVDVIPYDRL